MTIRKLRTLCFMGFLALAQHSFPPASAETPENSGAQGKIELKRGHYVVVSFDNLTNPAEDSWRYLQAFNQKLMEITTPEERSRMGCETNIDAISCEQLWAATGKGRPQRITDVRNVRYAVYRDDFSGHGNRRSIRALIEKAQGDFDEQESIQSGEKDQAIRAALGISGETSFPEPACSPPYAKPCYSRPVCTMYGGCSQSLTSCKQCSY